MSYLSWKIAEEATNLTNFITNLENNIYQLSKKNVNSIGIPDAVKRHKLQVRAVLVATDIWENLTDIALYAKCDKFNILVATIEGYFAFIYLKYKRE